MPDDLDITDFALNVECSLVFVYVVINQKGLSMLTASTLGADHQIVATS